MRTDRHDTPIQMTFDRTLNEYPLFNELLERARKARRRGYPAYVYMYWIDEMPEGTLFFAETCDRPRAPFWWLPWLRLERRADLDPDFCYEYERGDWDD